MRLPSGQQREGLTRLTLRVIIYWVRVPESLFLFTHALKSLEQIIRLGGPATVLDAGQAHPYRLFSHPCALFVYRSRHERASRELVSCQVPPWVESRRDSPSFPGQTWASPCNPCNRIHASRFVSARGPYVSGPTIQDVKSTYHAVVQQVIFPQLADWRASDSNRSQEGPCPSAQRTQPQLNPSSAD